MSAGQIGCREDQIEISDEDSSFGASESWIATCDDVRYVCARVLTGGGNYTTVSQVNCTREAHAQSEQRPAAPPAAAPVAASTVRRSAENTTSDPPTGAGGFRLAQSRDEARSACTAGGFEFAVTGHEGARCSGLPTQLGVKASAELALCNGAVCGIGLVADPGLAGSKQLETYASIGDALTKKYGEANESKSVLPAECQGERFRGCLSDGRVDLSQLWRWPTVTVRLSLRLDEGSNVPRLAVDYAVAKPAVQARPDAL